MDTVSLGSTCSDSTKTSSSARSKSRRNADDNDDETKDRVLSPTDLECFIQTERIMKLLDRAVSKTKLVLCLPLLMRDQTTLRKILDPQDFDEVSFIFDQYENPLFSTSHVNMEAAMGEIESGDLSLKQRLNPELAHLIYVMTGYDALKPIIEATVERIRKIPRNRLDRVPKGFAFLLELEQFRSLVETQLKTTAAEELREKLLIRKVERNNDNLKKRIEEYSSKIEEENAQFEVKILQMKQTIDKFEKEYARIQQATTWTLNKQILDSERQMVLLSRAHLVKKDMLKEVEEEIRETFDRLLHKDLLDEKTLRQRRIKVETQLMSWIQKYDIEMKDKQIDLDELTDKCDDETRMIEDLEEKLAEQDKEFEPLMAEREEEYHAEMMEKMTNFLVEHAARVIQMAWRETLANRAEKKKLKKALKKKQDMEEASARAAEAAEKRAEAAAKKAEKEAKKAEKEAKKQADAERRAAKEAASKEEK